MVAGIDSYDTRKRASKSDSPSRLNEEKESAQEEKKNRHENDSLNRQLHFSVELFERHNAINDSLGTVIVCLTSVDIESIKEYRSLFTEMESEERKQEGLSRQEKSRFTLEELS